MLRISCYGDEKNTRIYAVHLTTADQAGFVIGNIGKVEAMANIFDYIDWRGDLDLTQDPFNEVDSLILSTVSYIDFELIETDLKTEKATIREAGEQFNRLHADEKIKSKGVWYRTASSGFWM